MAEDLDPLDYIVDGNRPITREEAERFFSPFCDDELYSVVSDEFEGVDVSGLTLRVEDYLSYLSE